MKLKNLNLKELSSAEMNKIEGGVIGAVSLVVGILYMAGEIAESAGRAYRKNYL